MPTLHLAGPSLVVAALAVACAGAPSDGGGTVVATSPPRSLAPSAPSAPTAPTPPLGGPLTGRPRLVIENHSTAEINLHGGYIVDEAGVLGTMSLWPHPSDCPTRLPKERVLPLGGVHDLEAPAQAFHGSTCVAGTKLPAGRYVVHVASGFGAELYASAEITLPLVEHVRLRMERHATPPPCSPKRAARAARLVLTAAKEQGVTDEALAGCDATEATCGTLPLPEDAPPAKCALTLHENLMRIRTPPRGIPPKEISSWLDPDLVFAHPPDVSRSSSLKVLLSDGAVVVEGMAGRHMHEHGGKAARVGGMEVRILNTSKRVLEVSVTGIEWLTDSSCGIPSATGKQPAVAGVEPKELPPGISTLTIHFTPQDAYQVHCDVFASRASLRIAGKAAAVTSEHEVMRFEPSRRR